MVRRRLSLNRHPSTAGRLPDFLQRSSVWAKVSAFASNHLNFYRIHLLVFTFVPLIVSGIFYASNGPSEENQIPYVDSLFMCTSAMTVTGLNSVLLARLTLWQTVILFFLMAVGSPPSVSIIVLLIRRQFFRNKFDYMVANDARIRDRINEIGAQEAALHGRSYHPFSGQPLNSTGHNNLSTPWFSHLLPSSRGNSSPVTPRPSPANSGYPTMRDEDAEAREREKEMEKNGGNGRSKGKKRKKLQSLTADMIKRVDVPVRVNEMSVSGRLGEGRDREKQREREEEEDGKEREARELRERGIVRIDAGESESEDDGEGEGRGRRTHSPLPVTRPPTQQQVELPTVFADDDDDDDEDDAEKERNARPARQQQSGESVVERHLGALVSDSPETVERPFGAAGHPRAIQIDDSSKPARALRGRRSSDSAAASPHRAPGGSFPRVRTLDHRHLDQITESPSPMTATPTSPTFPRRDLDMGRTRTIEFRDPADYPDLRLRRQRTLAPIDPDFPTPRRMSHSNLREMHARTLTRTGTVGPVEQSAMHTGFGGFPNPIVAAASLAKSKLPALRGVMERNMTMPRTTTMMSTHSHPGMEGRGGTIGGLGVGGEQTGGMKTGGTGNVKPVTYISFDAVVGRNSKFHGLTTAQQEELGGVEYRALTALLRIVPAYWLLSQLIAVLCLAPWLSVSKTYKPVFDGPDIDVNPTWFTFFQVWSSFSNNGMSLSDSSMIPFQRAYWLIIVQGLLILGGNTAFPVFLRLVIWIISHIVPRRSRTRETLQFLLDHPRRCFIYLFPSHQTWFLVFTLVCLNGIDWAAFCILDIGNPVIEAIPVGTRIIDGLFQAFAVRAAGFAIVPLASVAPALQLLYVIMMYIAVYPIAVSIRTTNVYEEKSMGVYDEDFDEDEDDVEARFDRSHSATQYIGYHARKQLAFDLWWLALAVWLICIVERHRIGSDDWPEVSIFSLIFEIVSAYGTVGLSLGNNRNNTSLAGVLSTLSKLIVIAVMIRGRHRGLPIAIDRAVLLPSDLEKHLDDTATATSVDNPNNEFGLRSRGTRASFGSHTATTPRGLDRVEPLTDEARAEMGKQGSGHGGDHTAVGAGSPNLVERDLTDSSQEYLAESGTSSSGKETANGEVETVEMRELSGKTDEKKEKRDEGEEKTSPTDRNQVGWR